jgi:microcystin-dependent protein
MAQEYLGAVKLFAGNFTIKGYAACAGQLMSIQQNTALFSLLGTVYGGNGTQTFGLPDLRGRVPVHQGNGAGLTPRVIGAISGTENATLLQTNVPSHTHFMNAATNATTSSVAGSTVLPGGLKSADGGFYAAPGQPDFTTQTMNPAAVGMQGGNLGHNNMQPSLVINFMIALQGIFPSRN